MAAAEVTTALLVIMAFSGLCTGFYLDTKVATPSFCKTYDCPRFNELYKTDDYEARMYEPSKWVSTTITGIDYSDAEMKGFERLFAYIQGENVKNATIPMTVPVINRITPGPGPVCASNFTVSFFVPFAWQANTPAPTSPDLKITTLAQHKVYVRAYTGFSPEKTMVQEAVMLASLLNSTQPYDESFYYNAGYDSPFVIRHRHNEIWFFATSTR